MRDCRSEMGDGGLLVNVKVKESLVAGGWLALAERGPTEDWDLKR
jgi:hypothetical protein